MAYAIMRGANGRRHEVDFDDAEIAVEIFKALGDAARRSKSERPTIVVERR